ncbi:MAG: DUF4410 domain-containing protein [Chthoniobacterales bacterium]|nr:DUF4410 domain-containing protein [Chthoniobacterales bacterium]
MIKRNHYFCFLSALWLLGCASVSIKKIKHGEATPRKLPERIYVEKFKAPRANFHVNRKGKQLEQLIEEERTQLAQDLTLRLTKYIAPAVLLKAGEQPPQGNFWLVKGSFELVEEGSRLLRAGVGLGLGKTRMDTCVTLIDLSEFSSKEMEIIHTTGGSGLLPGAAAAFTPIGPFVLSTVLVNAGGAAGGALGSGISIDSRRTSREIVAAISDYAFRQGLISSNHHLHPKYLGETPPLFSDH